MSIKPFQPHAAPARPDHTAGSDVRSTQCLATVSSLSDAERAGRDLAEVSLTGITPAGANLEWLLDKVDLNNGPLL